MVVVDENNRMDISRCEFWQSAPFFDYILESARDEMKDGVGGWWSWISDWFDFGKWKGILGWGGSLKIS